MNSANRHHEMSGCAFGPYGASVAISQIFGNTKHSKRGAQIAKGIKSANPLEEKGIEEIRIAASMVYDAAGDFTKLACILTAAFLNKGQELIDKGFHPRDVVRSLEELCEQACANVTSQASPVQGDDLLAIARTAAGDKRVGSLVTEGIKRAGKHGLIAIETSRDALSSLEVLEGMRFDRGYLSNVFVTDVQKLECVLTDCYILAFQRRISSMRDFLPLLEEVARSERALLIIAEDVESEALSTLTVNKLRGILRCAAVRAPGEGDRRKAILEDIAVLTGGVFYSDELGIPLSSIGLQGLGCAEKVIVTANDTTIIGGAGKPSAVQDRITSIKAQIANVFSEYDREKLQERLAMLAGSVVMIKAGATSEAELLQEKYRVESAMFSGRQALDSGYVLGGGVALVRAGEGLSVPSPNTELGVYALEAFRTILREPMQQLVQNAGLSPTSILEEISKSDLNATGFNAERGRVEDLRAAGILDPAKSIKLALRAALSRARFVLQTVSWDISPIPTPKRAASPDWEDQGSRTT